MALLTTKEAAKFLNRSVGTLNYWRAVGKGPAWIDQEGRIRYDSQELERYIKCHTRTPTVTSNVEAKLGSL